MAWLTKDDLRRWQEGIHFDSYERLGAHPTPEGTWFAVWAPHADSVAVLGDFNDWDGSRNPLERTEAGVWQGLVSGAKVGHKYKYRIQRGYYTVDKSDPYAFAMEQPSAQGHAIAGLASIVSDLSYQWTDDEWMRTRK
ncbi:MAG TPA: 1,4-alpha-glucan branching enzyme, partial [Rhodothermales bacterium]